METKYTKQGKHKIFQQQENTTVYAYMWPLDNKKIPVTASSCAKTKVKGERGLSMPAYVTIHVYTCRFV